MAKKEQKSKLIEGMHDQSLAGKNPQTSTQQYLDISEIRDGVIVLRNGALRGIIMVSSMNFSLKSTEEQEAIIMAYQGFLNSVDFPIQILIQSRRLDIDKYVGKLNKREKEQENELLRIQTAEYAEYVKELVEMAQIMSKSFFITIPYHGTGKDAKTGLNLSFNPAGDLAKNERVFQSARTQILQRIQHIQSGLESLGLTTVILETQELIELMYNYYNPQTFQQEKLANLDKLETHN